MVTYSVAMGNSHYSEIYDHWTTKNHLFQRTNIAIVHIYTEIKKVFAQIIHDIIVGRCWNGQMVADLSV